MKNINSGKVASQKFQPFISKALSTIFTALLILTVFTGTAQAGPTYIHYKSCQIPTN